MSNIKEIEPQRVFKWFYQINQIPRCSYDEKKISDFLVDFAKDRNLEVYQDELNNVIIKKPGTEGYEDSDSLILQGHMDMVCVKGNDSDHDFTKDPIEMIVEGDLLRANDTTLGADDGIAVAYGLAILDAHDLKHPPLELLVTTNEESGMDGAHGLKNDHIQGKTLLNIDSEEEGTFLVSCAGGTTKITTFKLEKEIVDGDGLEIIISGLKGGHSGMEIIKQRANAIKLMGRILDISRKNSDIQIVKLTGGIKHNAIPSNARASFLSQDKDKLSKIIEGFSKELKEEYRIEDEALTIDIKEIKVKEAYTKELTENLVDYIIMCPDGVQSMSKDIERLVQSSLNNAIIEEKEDSLEIITSIRSASSSLLKEISTVLETIAKRTGGVMEEKGAYPAWQYDEDSKIRDKALKVYKNLFKEEGKVSAIHAGLECGILKEILPETDMISFGPNIYDVHTEKENISIQSVSNIWKFLIELLESLK